jgi:pyrimidine-nucleoside phosphorylase
MTVYDILEKKAAGRELTYDEINFFINGLCSGRIKDYQTSALIMAIFINGMADKELANLTLSMADSGDKIDLNDIEGIKVDKHSTGGVGDKTTLVIAPIIAACGGKIAKMSGRSLGFTGGTIDKLESIPGFRIALGRSEFINFVNKIGISIIGQTENIAPADKKIYALRDITATVNSIPLIASSIMSKKLASGADKILLDVKMGSGAFMNSYEDAIELAETMVRIGALNGKDTSAIITNMNRPLGNKIGNLNEIIEAVDTLKGEGPEDLTELCLMISSQMLCMAGLGSYSYCKSKAEEVISNGKAFNKFVEFVEAQNGDLGVIEYPEKYYKRPSRKDILASETGYLGFSSVAEIGKASVALGAGRATKESDIDYVAGIEFYKKPGDYVIKNDVICTVSSTDSEKFDLAEKILNESFCYLENKNNEDLLLGTVNIEHSLKEANDGK